MALYLNLSIRTLLVLLLLLFITRILGRRTLSELTFYDFVIGLIIGHIGGSIITEEFGIHDGIIALSLSTLWVLAINLITLKSVPARKLIESEPLLVISKGKILENNLKKRYYNVNDILEMLREKEIFDPTQVETGFIEADGQISVLKKPEFQSPTNKDLSIQPPELNHPNIYTGKELIIDGKILDQNLSQFGLTREQLKNKLTAMNIASIDEVMVAMITPDGKLYVDKRKDYLDTDKN